MKLTTQDKVIRAQNRKINRLKILLSSANCKGLKLICKKIDLQIEIHELRMEHDIDYRNYINNNKLPF
jgi:hypothetical protein